MKILNLSNISVAVSQHKQALVMMHQEMVARKKVEMVAVIVMVVMVITPEGMCRRNFIMNFVFELIEFHFV